MAPLVACVKMCGNVSTSVTSHPASRIRNQYPRKAKLVSRTLFAYLTSTPSLEEMGATLQALGIPYHHTLPADGRWNYPMHIFERAGVRLVYHAGDASIGEAMINTRIASDDVKADALVQHTLDRLVDRFGGIIHDPAVGGRGSVA